MRRVWLRVALAAGAGLVSLVVCSGALVAIVLLLLNTTDWSLLMGSSSWPSPIFWVGLVILIIVAAAGLSLPARALGATKDHVTNTAVLSALGPADEELPLEEWLSVDAEVLVPAAVSYAITPENCDRVTAKVIVEAANVPITEEAEQKLLERSIAVIPDFIANAGAVGWAWWTLFGDVSAEPQDSFDKLSSEMRSVVGELMESWKSGEGSPRRIAKEMAERNLDECARQYGEAASSRSIL